MIVVTKVFEYYFEKPSCSTVSKGRELIISNTMMTTNCFIYSKTTHEKKIPVTKPFNQMFTYSTHSMIITDYRNSFSLANEKYLKKKKSHSAYKSKM